MCTRRCAFSFCLFAFAFRFTPVPPRCLPAASPSLLRSCISHTCVSVCVRVRLARAFSRADLRRSLLAYFRTSYHLPLPLLLLRSPPSRSTALFVVHTGPTTSPNVFRLYSVAASSYRPCASAQSSSPRFSHPPALCADSVLPAAACLGRAHLRSAFLTRAHRVLFLCVTHRLASTPLTPPRRPPRGASALRSWC